jgi:hypothetical protein
MTDNIGRTLLHAQSDPIANSKKNMAAVFVFMEFFIGHVGPLY